MRPVLRLLARGRGHGQLLLLSALLSALTFLCAVGLMGVSAWLISRAAEHPEASALTLAAVAVRALGLGRGVSRYADRLVGHDVTLKVVADLRVAVFQALVRRKEDSTRSGELLSAVVVDVEAMQDLWLRCLIPFAAAVIVSAASVVACWWWVSSAGLVLLLGLISSLVVVPVLSAAIGRRESALAGRRADYQVQVLDIVQGCADLLVCGDLPRAVASAEQAAAGLADVDRRSARRSALVSAVTTVLHGGTVVGVAAVAVPAVQDGRLPRVGLAVVVLIAMAAFEPITLLVDAGALLPRTWGAARRLAALLEAPDEEGTGVVHGDPDTVRARSVRVRYPNALHPALEGIDLDLTPGRAIAVVGPSGAGKSTLLRVLTGQVVPESGKALLGTTALCSVESEQRARYVVLAEQEAYLFDASIRDNLRIARPGASELELAAAAELAGLGGWIEELPQGWDTPLGERGGRVSGGERKRLSVARVLLSEAPVVLMDEPTEGLDPDAADALIRRVIAASRQRALLLVTHRLTVLDEVDEVIVLDHGHVVQRGTHEGLLAEPGLYRDLQRAQTAATAALAG